MEASPWLTLVWHAAKEIVGILALVWLILGFSTNAFRGLRLFVERRGRMERRLTAARLDSQPPLLLLRSFFEEGVQSVDDANNSISSLLRYLLRFGEQPSVDFVAKLSHATRTYGPLLAIGGRELEKPGLSKTRYVVFIESSERDWEFLFSTIAHASRAIFVLPASSDGLLREVSLLAASGITEKAIVFMPGTSSLRDTRQEALAVLEDKWSEIRARWTSAGLHLPEYVAKGMLYIPNIDFSIKHFCLLDASPRLLN